MIQITRHPLRRLMPCGASLIPLMMIGCIYLPALDRPTLHGRSIPAPLSEHPQSLQGATREDLLIRIGEPDWIAADGTVLVYCWETLEGVIIVASPGGGGSAEVTSAQFLLVQVDDDGRVIRAERTSAKWFQPTLDRVEEWIREGAPSARHGAPVP